MQNKGASMQEVVSNFNIQDAMNSVDDLHMSCEIKCAQNESLEHVLQVLFLDTMRKNNTKLTNLRFTTCVTVHTVFTKQHMSHLNLIMYQRLGLLQYFALILFLVSKPFNFVRTFYLFSNTNHLLNILTGLTFSVIWNFGFPLYI